MAWRVEISKTGYRHIAKLDRLTQTQIARYLRERVYSSDNPRQFGKPLRGEKKGLWRYRVGDYRIICALHDETHTVEVLALGHRREIYR